MGPLVAVLDRFWGLLGSSWGALEASRSALGTSWHLPGLIKNDLKILRTPAGSGKAEIAPELRLPMFSRLTRPNLNQRETPLKVIYPVIQVIRSYLSIY